MKDYEDEPSYFIPSNQRDVLKVNGSFKDDMINIGEDDGINFNGKVYLLDNYTCLNPRMPLELENLHNYHQIAKSVCRLYILYKKQYSETIQHAIKEDDNILTLSGTACVISPKILITCYSNIQSNITNDKGEVFTLYKLYIDTIGYSRCFESIDLECNLTVHQVELINNHHNDHHSQKFTFLKFMNYSHEYYIKHFIPTTHSNSNGSEQCFIIGYPNEIEKEEFISKYYTKQLNNNSNNWKGKLYDRISTEMGYFCSRILLTGYYTNMMEYNENDSNNCYHHSCLALDGCSGAIIFNIRGEIIGLHECVDYSNGLGKICLLNRNDLRVAEEENEHCMLNN